MLLIAVSDFRTREAREFCPGAVKSPMAGVTVIELRTRRGDGDRCRPGGSNETGSPHLCITSSTVWTHRLLS
jgi:hypothetical protein